MAKRSGITELERYLQIQAAEGSSDSRGEFTLARAEALKKMAQHQLPFADAWAVKIIQSIVAGGSTKPIRVDLCATSTSFYFLEPGFKLEELLTAFFNPERSSNMALCHLTSALWVIGIRNSWGFQVALPGEKITLIWDGKDLLEVSSEQARDCACITVAPLQCKASTASWVAGVVMSGKRNADIVLALERNCYVCPLPLTADGRRLDALQKARVQGRSFNSYPIAFGTVASELKSFRLPPGTFEKAVGATSGLSLLAISRGLSSLASSRGLSLLDSSRGLSLLDSSGGGWGDFSTEKMSAIPVQSEASLAYITAVHMMMSGYGKSADWQEGRDLSMLYWVLDGAVVEEEFLISERSHCSIGCFISAEGLETDISSFKLVAGEEKKKRYKTARLALLQAKSQIESVDLDAMVSSTKRRFASLGGIISGVGLLSIVANPVFGLFLTGIGVAIFVTASSKARTRVQAASFSLRALNRKLSHEISKQVRHYS